jgi:hypothetical protein
MKVPPPSLMLRQQRAMEQSFIEAEYFISNPSLAEHSPRGVASFGKTFHEIHSVDELWHWIQQVVVPGMGPGGSIPDTMGLNQVLGPVRLHQTRSEPAPCLRNRLSLDSAACTMYWSDSDVNERTITDERSPFVPRAAGGANASSFPHLGGLVREQAAAFLARGCEAAQRGEASEKKECRFGFDDAGAAFVHTEDILHGNLKTDAVYAEGIWGSKPKFGRSGYFLDIPTGDNDRLDAVVKELQTVNFLDKYTRAFLLQFVVYNQNDVNNQNEGPKTSLFGEWRGDKKDGCIRGNLKDCDGLDEYVTVIDASFSFSPSGSVTKNARVSTIQLEPFTGHIFNLETNPGWTLFCFLLLVRVMYEEFREFSQKHLRYFQDLANWVEFFFVGFMGYTVYKFRQFQPLVEESILNRLDDPSEDFGPGCVFFEIMPVRDAFRQLTLSMGLLCLVSIVKSFKYVR